MAMAAIEVFDSHYLDLGSRSIHFCLSTGEPHSVHDHTRTRGLNPKSIVETKELYELLQAFHHRQPLRHVATSLLRRDS